MRPERSAGRTAVVRVVSVVIVTLVAMIGVAAIELNRLAEGQRPAIAATLWPGHPNIVRDEAMRDIGLSAARGGDVPPSARQAMWRQAQAEPLRIHPYIVEATVAATAGDAARAERLFVVAAARNPRSVLAHFSLADRYLRSNRLSDGLAEISVMARLVPAATMSLAAPIAVYARQSGTTPAIRQFFARSPQLAPLVLTELAKDPAQADRAIALGAGLPAAAADRRWQETLVQTLIANRQFPRALAAWRKLAGVAPFTGLYNPGFAPASAPPPFNWVPFSGSGALAEPAPGGGLKVAYYGRDEIVITRQMLVLTPGRYMVAMRIGEGPVKTASRPGAATSTDAAANVGLSWQVSCVDSGAVLGTLPLDAGKLGRAALSFAVPASCGAQWLTLRGTAGQFGEPVALTISALALSPGQGA